MSMYFDVFVGRKVISTSCSSAILKILSGPPFLKFVNLVKQNAMFRVGKRGLLSVREDRESEALGLGPSSSLTELKHKVRNK